ncbi:hypothetical protein LGL55_17735 [Clostridium tagluense]|uniref:hypothetical protein n=1 Tax=Clostridium tagluense TaxID=360422 RepID=UPI001C0D95F3|nr:hypothetical protein [Clostridium tagluense]MBU3128787.1 hypothetical protein [Clostridium tagluense]MCB2313038.1 hypothetical protein [Clostridium tagluense]MCB2317853.1 hypothetical protein [Clostridium tagluense]MCB2322638.1 hypothetical protein [Clostridium tagluense]MCB2327587.1 hypothetical protein [Clostridium tagluense]
MRIFKLAKYNIKSSLKSIIIYYFIFIGTITGIEIMIDPTTSGNTWGLEFSSIIFLFVIGLNFFRENFHFTQANNITRGEHFKAAGIAILAIGLAMSIIDVIINRVYNIFTQSPTMYDKIYTEKPTFVWIQQSNSIGTLFGTVTFLFAFYITAFAIGLLITMIYYRCNKIMKILVSLSPIAIYGIIICNNYYLGDKVNYFISDLLGIKIGNFYMAVMTFICLFIIIMFFVYLLVRKAVVKKN